jgi:hypothetical protein
MHNCSGILQVFHCITGKYTSLFNIKNTNYFLYAQYSLYTVQYSKDVSCLNLKLCIQINFYILCVNSVVLFHEIVWRSAEKRFQFPHVSPRNCKHFSAEIPIFLHRSPHVSLQSATHFLHRTHSSSCQFSAGNSVDIYVRVDNTHITILTHK